MTTNDHFMSLAVALSQQSVASGGGPFGAIIVQNGQVIAQGTNRVTPSNDPTAHAEVVAIRAACTALGTFSLQGCTIYTSCEPCPMCLGAIYWARISRIFYANTKHDAAQAGFSDAQIYTEIATEPTQRSIPAMRLDSPQALEVFRLWCEDSMRRRY